jgi:hypothetical protein
MDADAHFVPDRVGRVGDELFEVVEDGEAGD